MKPHIIMNINKDGLKKLIKECVHCCITESSSNVTNAIHLKRLYNNPDKNFAIRNYGSVEKYRKMLKSKLAKMSHLKPQKNLKESTPPGFPLGLKKKILRHYKNSPEKAYATMNKLHSKYGNKLEEMWVSF